MINKPVSFSIIRSNVLEWVESVRDKNTKYGRYRFHNQSPVILYASLFASLIRELFDDLNSISYQQRKEWIEYIQSAQNPVDGFFYDENVEYTNNTDPRFNEYRRMNLTYFCIHALDVLNAVPKFDLVFMKQFDSEEKLNKWLSDSICFDDPWKDSNWIMWILSLMFFQIKVSGKKDYLNLINHILDWLDNAQDPNTGIWGTDKGSSLFYGVAAAYHFFMFYYALDRPINYTDRILDSTLSVQLRDGFFAPNGGGACVDLDAIDILVNVNVGVQNSYRSMDIKQALERSFFALLSQQNNDGGFAEAKKCNLFSIFSNIIDLSLSFSKHKDPKTTIFHVKSVIKSSVIPKYRLTYVGIRGTDYLLNESNMWASWFRPLSLILINEKLDNQFFGEISYNYRKMPGLGFINKKLD